MASTLKIPPPTQEYLPLDATLPRQEKPRLTPLSLPSVAILAWTVRLAAVINFIAFALPHTPKVIYWLADWVPFEISAGRRILMLLTAILLFTLASGLERGKRLAWTLSIIALSAAPMIHFGRMLLWPQILLNLPLIVLLVAKRHYFVARSDHKSVSRALTVCPLLLLMLLVGGTIRLHALRFETTGPDSWLGCVQAASELVLVQNSHAQKAETFAALHTFSVLRIGGTSIALIALILALRPVSPPRRPTEEQVARARKLIAEYGHDPVDSYALLDDKSLFFSSEGSVLIPYVVSRRFTLALGDPIGPTAAKAGAIGEFSAFCRRHDWIPLFYQTSEELSAEYRKRDFDVVKIGEDARIKCTGFELKGREFQNLRTLCNQARKQGISFVWHQAGNLLSAETEHQLHIISEQWLQRKNGIEMGFDMGSYSPEDIELYGAGLAVDAQGKILAFTTWRPFANGRGRALDLMRSGPNSRGVLDFVLVESILNFSNQGVTDISLGNAPLADAGGASPDTKESKLIRFVYENLNQLYAYKPLFEFKRKYRPNWRARFLAYPAGESLPLVGLALVRVHAPQGSWKFLRPKRRVVLS